MQFNRTIYSLLLLFLSVTTLVQCAKEESVSAPNKPPVANAGTAQTISTTQATLDGSKSIDPDGTISTYKWEKISGPSAVTIVNPGKAITIVTGLQQGIYTFQLTITDNKGASNSATVTIIVSATPNQAPVAHAGADQTITLPISTVKLNPTNIPSTDADGNIIKYEWTKVSGPGTCAILTPNKDTTTVTGLQEGSYIFQLIVTDNKGATNSDSVTVTVNRMIDQKPIPSASNITIYMPTNTVMLDGSASTDYNGSKTGLTYKWEYIPGESIFDPTITNATTATPTISNLIEDVIYNFKFTVTNSNGTSNSITVSITVKIPLQGVWKGTDGSTSLQLAIATDESIKADVTISGTTRNNLAVDYAIVNNSRQINGLFQATEGGTTYTYVFTGTFNKPDYTQLTITSLKLDGTEALASPLILTK